CPFKVQIPLPKQIPLTKKGVTFSPSRRSMRNYNSNLNLQMRKLTKTNVTSRRRLRIPSIIHISKSPASNRKKHRQQTRCRH
ncbi:MAG: hypothetical protein O2817_13105, partial [Proteobacteria bacterium]|nr:hypothetical protein [Pseudomonadota bacterium]